MAWNPAGTRLASAGSDILVTIWESDGRTPPRLLRGHSWMAYGVAWSSDGRLLASSGLDNAVQVWNATTEAGVQTLRDPNHVDTSFFGIEWSPDGRFVAGGSYQQEVQVWEVSTGTRLWVGRGQPTTIRRVAWSPDGMRLANCGDDGAISIWELESGEHLRTLRRDRPYERLDITGIRGVTQAQKASLRALGAIESPLASLASV